MPEAKVSIIVPVYNTEKYLERCIESVLNQTLQDIEVILVNDGSTDKSGWICDEYARKDKRVRVIHQDNGGEAKARNAGISASRGKLIGFVDSDDYVSSDYFEKMLAPYNKYPGLDIVISGMTVIYPTRKRIISWEKESILDRRRFVSSFFLIQEKGMINTVWNKLYLSELAKKVRFNSDRKIGPDLVFNLEYLPLCRNFAIIPEHGYFYIMRGKSVTGRSIDHYHPEHELEKSIEWRRMMGSFFERMGITAENSENYFLGRRPLWFYTLAKNVILPGTPYGFTEQANQIGKIMKHAKKGKFLQIKAGREKLSLFFFLCRLAKSPLIMLLLVKTAVLAEACYKDLANILPRPTNKP